MKIGICFPAKDFEILEMNDMKAYISMFKEKGLASFDFFTSFFYEIDSKKEELLKYLIENDIKLTFHYNKVNDYLTDLNNLTSYLIEKGINYHIPIVFHLEDYIDDKYDKVKDLIDIYQELVECFKDTNFDILLETLSLNHPIGNHLGDENSELLLFLNSISDLGICWDIGHTRLNSIELGNSLILPSDIMNKVRHTHIHNIMYNECFIDHLPLTNMEYQYDEIKYLVDNNYKYTYSIETEVSSLNENILVYLDSISKLKKLIIKLEEEK